MEKDKIQKSILLILITSLILGMFISSSSSKAAIEEIEVVQKAELTVLTKKTTDQDQIVSEYRRVLDDTQATLDDTQTNLDDTQTELDDAQTKLVEMQIKLDELQYEYSKVIPSGSPGTTAVDVVKEVPVYIEVEKKVSVTFKEFEDLTELEVWLENNRLPIVLVAGSNGVTGSSSIYDCDDYAEDLQRKALEQGFVMSRQLLLNGRIFGTKVTDITEPHMGNLTIIGNDIYYIESIPPHTVVKITNRD